MEVPGRRTDFLSLNLILIPRRVYALPHNGLISPNGILATLLLVQ